MKRAVDILILIPNFTWRNQRPWRMIPYGIPLLCALLKGRFSLALLDANATDMSLEECREGLGGFQPRMVMMSAVSLEYQRVYFDALALVKDLHPQALTVMGGPFVTTMERYVMAEENLDFAFLGPAEERVIPFVQTVLAGAWEALEAFDGLVWRPAPGEVRVNVLQSFVVRLTRHVQPDYSLFDLNAYFQAKSGAFQGENTTGNGYILTSYGCPYNCTFCSARAITGRGSTFRPEADVLAEIDYLVAFGLRVVTFLDDCILQDRERFMRILTTMRERHPQLTWRLANGSIWHMDHDLLVFFREMGCTTLNLSVESGCQRVLKELMHKPLKLDNVVEVTQSCWDLGIFTSCNFVIGMPGETMDELWETVRFAEGLASDYVTFSIATPLPKTELLRLAEEKGYLMPDFSFNDFHAIGFSQPYLITEEITPFDLVLVRIYEYDRINFSRPERRQRIARAFHITPEELEAHRRQVRHQYPYFLSVLQRQLAVTQGSHP